MKVENKVPLNEVGAIRLIGHGVKVGIHTSSPFLQQSTPRIMLHLFLNDHATRYANQGWIESVLTFL
jgi:hypothetical protein